MNQTKAVWWEELSIVPILQSKRFFFEILPLFFPRVIIVFFSFRTITRVREPDPSVTRPN